jgi:hypothetical protein
MTIDNETTEGFAVNDHVVCVDDTVQDRNGDRVKKNEQYVVRAVEPYYEEVQTLFLTGLHAGWTGEEERGFSSLRFKKVRG